MTTRKLVHGDDLLYRFFQDGFEQRPELFRSLAQRLVRTTSIWLPLDAYERWPILLPWVVRDPTCRGNRRKGVPDEWSAPNVRGYLRDDNSLIKAIPRSLTVAGPRGSHLHGARMGSEFVASHVWRVVRHVDLASRHPLLNSFVPNLVWLPGQVAKLSDREGGIIQETLQAMSRAVFRHANVLPRLRSLVEEAWGTLPEPEMDLEPFDPADLNWFRTTPAFFRTRSARLGSVIAALDALELNQPLGGRVITRRYAAGLPLVSCADRTALRSQLERFRERKDEA
jgi:hypothetical protein